MIKLCTCLLGSSPRVPLLAFALYNNSVIFAGRGGSSVARFLNSLTTYIAAISTFDFLVGFVTMKIWKFKAIFFYCFVTNDLSSFWC